MGSVGRPQGAVGIEVGPGGGLHSPSDFFLHALSMAQGRAESKRVCASLRIGTVARGSSTHILQSPRVGGSRAVTSVT
jgi:hypothetical protein